MTTGAIIVRGRSVLTGCKTVHYRDSKLQFINVMARACRPDICVLHWTAGENSAETTFNTLKAKQLSVHFVIDNYGVIYQFADPAFFACMHAGSRANKRSVGIEVSSYGWRRPGARNPNIERDEYRTTIHSWSTRVADYLPEQYTALLALTDVLSSHLPIPRIVPSLNRRMTADELGAFSGYCGHYHVDRLEKKHPKIDPGTRPFDVLRGHFGHATED